MKVKKLFVTDGSDLAGVQRTADILHVQRMGRVLVHYGAWILKDSDEKRPGLFKRSFAVFWAVIHFPANIGALYFEDKKNMLKVGNIVCTIGLNVVGLNKCGFVCTRRYWDLVHNFLDEIHLFNHRQRNKYFFEVYGEVHKHCHTLSGVLSVVLVTGVALFNLQPVYLNLASGVYTGADVDYAYCLYLWIPHMDLKRELAPYIFCTILNFLSTVLTVCIIWMPDLLAMEVVIHIWGHIRVLGNEMKAFTEEMEREAKAKGKTQFDEQESAAAKYKLKYFVDSHRKILGYVDSVNYTFSAVLWVYDLYFKVSLCVMMWMCTQGKEGLMQYGCLTVSTVFSLALLSIVIEMISTENETLERHVYCLPWQLMRTPERRTVFIMMLRVQTPMRINALGLVDIGVANMAAILKTSFSYFIFLRSME